MEKSENSIIKRKRDDANKANDSDEISAKRPPIYPYFSLLPVELLEKILEYCDVQTILNCRCVCKRICKFLDESEIFWEKQALCYGMTPESVIDANPDNMQKTSRALRHRLKAISMYNENVVTKFSTTRIVGLCDEGILIHLDGNLQFYGLNGQLMRTFLNKVDDDDFNFKEYDDFLLFDHPYSKQILTWSLYEKQIHLCNESSIEIWDLKRPTSKLDTEDLSTYLRANRAHFEMSVLPHNVKVIKKRSGDKYGVSITFCDGKTVKQRALFMCYPNSATLLLNSNNAVRTATTHKFPIKQSGIYVRGDGRDGQAINVYMASDSPNNSYLIMHTTNIEPVDDNSIAIVQEKPNVFLRCNPKSCGIVAVGNSYIVIFDNDEYCLKYYKHPKEYTKDVIKPSFTVHLDRNKILDLDWQNVKFIFPNDIDDGIFGTKGVVKICQCSNREDVTVAVLLT